jgi:hypothetical protein
MCVEASNVLPSPTAHYIRITIRLTVATESGYVFTAPAQAKHAEATPVLYFNSKCLD